ncbi:MULTISPECIES: hypothetical protein [unclassified Streptomyces]
MGQPQQGDGQVGRYDFTASVPAAGALRPLRDPDSPELAEDDDGSGQE